MCVCELRPRTSGAALGPLGGGVPLESLHHPVMASSVSVLLRPGAAPAAPKPKLAGGKSGVDVWRERRWRKGRDCRDHQDDQENGAQHGSLLKCLAMALELSAPASDVLLKSGSASLPVCVSTVSTGTLPPPSEWFQLAGHPDCFAPAGPGRIWKKVGDCTEKLAYDALSTDPALRGLVPRYHGSVTYRDHTFIELQDLLHGFVDPHVIDVKMGTRTFLESEVDNPTARADLYQKMVALDASAPTPEEHAAQAVTKVRYMQFREQQSSTHFLGFRVDGMKERGLPPRASDLRKVANRQEVVARMANFLGGRKDVQRRLHSRLCDMRARIEQSAFFRTHEVIGCSIFMLYDDRQVGAWLIDFAKTVPVPEHCTLDHRTPWTPGNREEGFLFGLDNLIQVLDDA
ncbi:inositol-trisphosphate 3-kinase homolog isoform X2 [Thrips palmi]|uniref:Kinase n=1 Tax=Thrips palmi TaxID=161013 RepID=A0A6P8ZMW1_THRPL|nr:inositol-trisphosphate 3-kinase homolog isoform X2 [Thrips palmi]